MRRHCRLVSAVRSLPYILHMKIVVLHIVWGSNSSSLIYVL